MTEAEREAPGEAADAAVAPAGRPLSDASRLTVRAFATSVAVAIALSAAAALLFGVVPRLVGLSAPQGCCGAPEPQLD